MSSSNTDHELSNFWSFCIHNFKLTLVLIVATVGVGVQSYLALPQESTPEIKVPIGIVTTSYPGVNALDIEKLITDEIEKETESLDNLDKITSTSSEGISRITVEFEADADIKDSIRELKDAVDKAKPSLPDEANDPIVTEVSFSDRPIVTFSLVGNFTYEELKDIADIIQDELESISGIDEARILGERKREIHIDINREALEGYRISIDNISQAIRSFHLNFPIGSILTDDLSYQVRLEGEFKTAAEIRNIPIASRDGTPIYIRDIAKVSERLAKETVYNRLSIDGSKPLQTISLSIYKSTGANVIQIVDKVKMELEKMQGELVPSKEDGLTIQVTNDTSEFIRDDFNALAKSALQTIVLIFFTLLFALGTKEAIIASIAIPLTFLITFIVLRASGNTINNVTLFGLVLGLGLLVDTAIVIMEGIHESVHKKKMSPTDAALDTIKTYKTPLISGTATTVSAFVPMYLMSGITGQFFSYIPTTVTAVLISSLIVSLTISPAIASKLVKEREEHQKKHFIERAKDRLVSYLSGKYTRLLSYLIHGRWTRVMLVIICFFSFLSAMALPITGIVKTESFPLADVNFFNIEVEAPEGTKLEKTNRIVKEVEKELLKDPMILNFVTSVGGGSIARTGSVGSASTSNSHTAAITVNLVKKEDREIKSYDISSKYRKLFEKFTDAEVSIAELRGGPPQGAPVEVRIFGDDLKAAGKIADDMRAEIEKLGGVQIKDSIDIGTGQFVFYPKIDKINRFGLTTQMVAGTLRNAVFGREVADIVRDGEEIEIWVRYDWGKEEKPLTISQIENIEIATPSGQYIPAKELADVRLEPSLLSLNHRETDRIVTVSSEAGEKDPNDIFRGLEKMMETYNLPDGFRVEMGGQTEDVQQSFDDLQNALSLAIILIALILVLQFNSFSQPFIILCTLPLSLIGVFYGFAFLQLKLGIAAFIGVVSLAGIVVNDAIVLIDRINNNRIRGMTINEAITEAGPARLQPILITSVTTVFGILPLTLTDEFWLGLGSAIIFGITFSTVLTLVVMPCLYKMFEDRQGKSFQRFGRWIARKVRDSKNYWQIN